MTTLTLSQSNGPDQLWNAIQPLPPEPPKPKVADLAEPTGAMAGAIVFLMRAGLPWRLLPAPGS